MRFVISENYINSTSNPDELIKFRIVAESTNNPLDYRYTIEVKDGEDAMSQERWQLVKENEHYDMRPLKNIYLTNI